MLLLIIDKVLVTECPMDAEELSLLLARPLPVFIRVHKARVAFTHLIIGNGGLNLTHLQCFEIGLGMEATVGGDLGCGEDLLLADGYEVAGHSFHHR